MKQAAGRGKRNQISERSMNWALNLGCLDAACPYGVLHIRRACPVQTKQPFGRVQDLGRDD